MNTDGINFEQEQNHQIDRRHLRGWEFNKEKKY